MRERRNGRLQRRKAVLALLASALTFFLAASARGGELSDALEARWLGAWVVLRAEVGSGCNDLFTNIRVVDGRPAHSASHTLPAGELGKVVKLKVKRARIDVFVELSERLRTSRFEGPFELFEQVTCRVELQMVVPRAVIRSQDPAAAGAILVRLLERHDSREAATASPAWNRRRVEALPDDYRQTLDEYHRWKESQLVAAMHQRLEELLDEAHEIVERTKRSAAFAEGLAEGLRRHRSTRLGSTCDDLVGAESYPSSADAPEGYGDGERRDWENGYRDGQRLAFAIELAKRLELCLR